MREKIPNLKRQSIRHVELDVKTGKESDKTVCHDPGLLCFVISCIIWKFALMCHRLVSVPVVISLVPVFLCSFPRLSPPAPCPLVCVCAYSLCAPSCLCQIVLLCPVFRPSMCYLAFFCLTSRYVLVFSSLCFHWLYFAFVCTLFILFLSLLCDFVLKGIVCFFWSGVI